jgi:hypothetical protein
VRFTLNPWSLHSLLFVSRLPSTVSPLPVMTVPWTARRSPRR